MYDHNSQDVVSEDDRTPDLNHHDPGDSDAQGATREVYLFTFGVQWNHEDHPTLGRLPKNGYIKTVGYDYEEARKRVDQVAKNQWAFQYSEQDFDPSFHPGKPFLTIQREDDLDTWCVKCGGRNGQHGSVHIRNIGGGGGSNIPCPLTPGIE